MPLNSARQFAQSSFQSSSDSRESVNRHIFFPALNVANVIVVQLSQFGQFFLAPFEDATARPYVFAENLSVFWNFDHCIKEPKTAYADYSIYTVFYSCLFPNLWDFGGNEDANRIFAQARP